MVAEKLRLVDDFNKRNTEFQEARQEWVEYINDLCNNNLPEPINYLLFRRCPLCGGKARDLTPPGMVIYQYWECDRCDYSKGIWLGGY